MTAGQKIAYIEKQMIAVMNERQNTVNCPYCDTHNMSGETLCCGPFTRASAAILLRWDVKEKMEHAQRIAEKVSRN